MIDPLQTIIIVASVLLALVVLFYVIKDREPDWTLLGLTGAVEALALVQMVIGFVQVARGTHEVDTVNFIGYLLTIVLILPLAFVWSLAERSRGATSVLVVAAVTVTFLTVRLGQVWVAG